MFTSRIAAGNQDRRDWIPAVKGTRSIKFSNGLTMAHDDDSRACEAFVRSTDVPAEFSADGVTIKATGLSAKAVLAILGAGKKANNSRLISRGPLKTTSQPLYFDNGFHVSHSDASRACANFVKQVDAGKLDIGMVAQFSSDHACSAGISKNAKKTLALLRG